MQVKFVAVTTPAVELQAQGIRTAEDLISYCARVSNSSNQLNVETGPKLLKYCLRMGHVSVFEVASLTLEIETSRAIAAQILRHRSFTFQEHSQRYSTVGGFEEILPRRQDTKNRQNSIDDLPDEVFNWFRDEIECTQEQAYALYNEAVGRGIAKESARFLLPLSVKTRLYMTGSVRSWLFYLKARTSSETQLEHRQVAEACKAIFTQQFPVVAEAVFGVES